MLKTKLVLVLGVVGISCLTFLTLRALPVHADPPSLASPPAIPLRPDSELGSIVPPLLAPEPSREDGAFVAYILGIMSSWPPADPSMETVPYHDVAETIALVTTSPDDAVLLAALAYWEGARYAAYVDDGRCNDPAWRGTQEGIKTMHRGGDCDHGHAHSLLQIHPIDDRSSPIHALCATEIVDGSRVGAFRCGLEIARLSMKETGSLVNYTGEWQSVEHPKADVRLRFARAALKKHPFKTQ